MFSATIRKVFSQGWCCGWWSPPCHPSIHNCLFSTDARTCGDCNTTSRATCVPSQGVAICTCKAGYIGDGLNCTAMVFCNTAKCCPKGYTWDVIKKQCADINECIDDTLNQCSPTDTCYNRNGIYLCAANRNAACGPSGKCSNDMDCLEVNGAAQCADPCYNYNTINGTGRMYNLASPGRFETDRNYFGWFRYVGKGVSLREGCVGALKCGSMQPFSLARKHPSIGDGIVMAPLLSNSISLGCVPGPSIPVKACSGGYWVYKYSGSLQFEVYCTGEAASFGGRLEGQCGEMTNMTECSYQTGKVLNINHSL